MAMEHRAGASAASSSPDILPVLPRRIFNANRQSSPRLAARSTPTYAGADVSRDWSGRACMKLFISLASVALVGVLGASGNAASVKPGDVISKENAGLVNNLVSPGN